MTYLAAILYLLGIYMQYHLGDKIISFNGKKFESIYMLIGAMLWPFACIYYLIKGFKRHD